MKVVVAEKPSVARELATFLGATARREGYFEGKGYQVTWALGHLATLMEPQDYDPALKKWSLATLPFVPEKFGLKPIDEGGSRKQLAVVRRLIRSADELICATDAGREGELIFRYIQELVGMHEKARASALAQLAHRVRHSRRLPAAAATLRLRCPLRGGPMPQRGGLGRRPERDAILHRQPPRQRDTLERRPGADTRPGHDRSSRRRDPHIQARAILGATDAVSRGDFQVHRRSIRQGGRMRRSCSSESWVVRFRFWASTESPSASRRLSCTI